MHHTRRRAYDVTILSSRLLLHVSRKQHMHVSAQCHMHFCYIFGTLRLTVMASLSHASGTQQLCARLVLLQPCFIVLKHFLECPCSWQYCESPLKPCGHISYCLREQHTRACQSPTTSFNQCLQPPFASQGGSNNLKYSAAACERYTGHLTGAEDMGVQATCSVNPSMLCGLIQLITCRASMPNVCWITSLSSFLSEGTFNR